MALVDAATEHYLEQWGRWCRKGQLGPKDAKSWLGVLVDKHNELPASKVNQFDSDDDLIELLDQRVMSIMLRSEAPESRTVYEILRDYYRGHECHVDGRTMYVRLSKSELADRRKMSRPMFEAKLRQGISRVQGMLEVMMC